MNESRQHRPGGGSGVLMVVVIYAVFGALWIVSSDGILKMLVQDAGQFAVVSMFKGWAYVAVTSLLLYGLLRRFELRPVKNGSAFSAPPRFRRWLPFALLALCVVGAGSAAIAYHWQQQQREDVSGLQILAELKSIQIADWLEQRRQNAAYLAGNRFFAELVQRRLAAGDAASSEPIQVWMNQYPQSMDFSAALLFDVHGRLIWASLESNSEVSPVLATAVHDAVAGGAIQRSGPYLDRGGNIHLDFVVPITVDNQAIAVVVLHIDSSRSLYQLLRKWPDSAMSCEMLIFRQDGDDVVFLNDLEHRPDAALKLRMPIASPGLLAAQLLQGQSRAGELIRGVDYRGEPAVGIGYAIPGTDWFLMAKKNSSEFYDSAVKDSAGIALICLLVLAIGGTLLTVQQQRGQLRLMDEHQYAERAVRLQAEVLANITEGVNVVGSDGRILYVNPAFAAMFGYAADELIGRNVDILNASTEEYSAEAVAALILDQLRTTGHWRGELLNRRKDGRVFWAHAIVSSHTMPIWGPVWLAVQHDITERKLVETKLNQRNALLERFNRAAVGRELDIVAMKRQVNVLAAELGRDPVYEELAADGGESPESWQAENPQLAQLAMINLLEDAQASRDEANAIAATLRESERRLLMAQEAAHVGIWEWNLRDGSLYWSPEYERLYGVPPDSPHSYDDWRARIHPDDLALLDAEWERHIDLGQPFEVEFRIRREDNGETRWIYCVGRARRDDNGEVVLLSGINIDITERKKVESALATSEQRYRVLADNLPGVVYRCEINYPWRMIMLSEGVKLLTGYDASMFQAEDATLTWGGLIVAEDMPGVERAVEAAIAARQTYRLAYRIHHADGGIRWVLEHGRAIYGDNGEPEFLDGVITDMTAQKSTEEQLRARNQELERFNQVTLGRELDMIEMKKQINALSQQLGREPPYPLAFLNGDEIGAT